MEEQSSVQGAVSSYCERLDPSFWAEPVNAVSNLAFVLAAIWMWYRISARGAGEAAGIARVLCVFLAGTGLASFLWHTFATPWSVALDVIFIALFSLTYIYAANRHFWGMRPLVATVATLAFFPYAAIVGSAFAQLPFFEISFFYWPLPLLIFGYGFALIQRRPETGRGLVIGASLLCLSLMFRSVDGMLCQRIPVGTHFLWHLLNGVMLGWMIEVLRRDRETSDAIVPGSGGAAQ